MSSELMLKQASWPFGHLKGQQTSPGALSILQLHLGPGHRRHRSQTEPSSPFVKSNGSSAFQAQNGVLQPQECYMPAEWRWDCDGDIGRIGRIGRTGLVRERGSE